MRKLWNWLQKTTMAIETKRRIFLLLNTVVWTLLPCVLCLLVALVQGIDAVWIEMTVIITGYLAFGFGFLGGCFFLMRNT